ncbi:NAD-dependent epimerase/dehydratase family protein [Dehalococcoidia bacterium]|nr:NAD-dependent epimerase/dehydratase family protein [Dehalococcoidia bacterium]
MPKFLVTGGAGFIGSHVVAELLKKGEEVRVADDLSKGQIKNIGLDKVEFVQADLMDATQARKAMGGIEYCFHFAAKIGGIGYFHKYPVESLRDNTLLIINVLEAARKEKGFQKFIYISSSMVLERTMTFPSKEEDVSFCPPPITHYGFSKLAGEYFCTAYQKQYGLKYAIFRPFNAYGPGEMSENEIGIAHVIPDLITKMFVDKQYPVEVLGDGNQVRAYTYVTDIAEPIANFGLDARSDNETFNVANPKAYTVKELAQIIWQIGGEKRELKFKHLPAFEDDVKKRIPDVTKITKAFNWRPKVELREGLERTIQWALGLGRGRTDEDN